MESSQVRIAICWRRNSRTFVPPLNESGGRKKGSRRWRPGRAPPQREWQKRRSSSANSLKQIPNPRDWCWAGPCSVRPHQLTVQGCSYRRWPCRWYLHQLFLCRYTLVPCCSGHLSGWNAVRLLESKAFLPEIDILKGKRWLRGRIILNKIQVTKWLLVILRCGKSNSQKLVDKSLREGKQRHGVNGKRSLLLTETCENKRL